MSPSPRGQKFRRSCGGPAARAPLYIPFIMFQSSPLTAAMKVRGDSR